ncbi:MAG: hypothetical protein IPH12_10635 [Saprospirales bacterium]|nr:hypothetical protein [Saprospirales bacterium]MBK8922269.1 hypothetical protein [Saprospirales bacterium]
MATFNCEVNLNAGFIVSNTGVRLGAESDDVNAIWQFTGDNPTNRMVSTDQSLVVDVEWTVEGPMASLMGNCKYICRLFLEQMGPGEAAPGFYQTQVNHIPVNGPTNYTAQISIPQGLSEGVYRVVFSFNMLDPNNNPFPVAGFEDLGFLQVFGN